MPQQKNKEGFLEKYAPRILFFKQILKTPTLIGALAPSSHWLVQAMCSYVECGKDEYVLELGVGTGVFTRELLKRGIAEERLILVERDPVFVEFLKENFPKACILSMDVMTSLSLAEALPPDAADKISTIVSSVPLFNMKAADRCVFVQRLLPVLQPQGQILQFSYRPYSPIRSCSLKLKTGLLGFIFLNVPPAFIWQYRKLTEQG
jgi:phosphatidylethanolamine/phosphatidyl-N-methylethanolamine N-methyltransferase